MGFPGVCAKSSPPPIFISVPSILLGFQLTSHSCPGLYPVALGEQFTISCFQQLLQACL